MIEKKNIIIGGALQETVLGCYAPNEPLLMQSLYRFLEAEKHLPLNLAHRVIDRLAGITMATQVMTHAEIVRFIEELPDDWVIAKGPCPCRKHTAAALGPDAMDLAGGFLNFCRQTPEKVDIQIGVSGAQFAKLEAYEVIAKDELLALERECHNMGLVANVYSMAGGETGICHCSSATCVPFLANEALGGESQIILRGRTVAATDADKCAGCGDCLRVCHFHVRHTVTIDERLLAEVKAERCYGCGLCADVCPQRAVTMVAR
ncbi:MAG TPA: 4Fe-4S dicluster domain-containing protein [bacterium]|nr:4Fe-4S dicluster domain-containing protein [bacterium]